MPLRVTREQWNDIKHHYQDIDESDQPPLCECEDPECEGEGEAMDDLESRNREIRQRMMDNGRWLGAASGAPKPTGTSDEEWFANRKYYRNSEPLNEDNGIDQYYEDSQSPPIEE